MKLVEQIEKGESKILEFKEALPKNESLAKTIVAFSNTSGGKLIIGVDDDHKVVGVRDNLIFKMKDQIASIISDNCSPSILPEIYNVNINGKVLVVVEVVRGNLKPYFIKKQGKAGGTYVRLGATNRNADSDTIAELERQRRNISFDEDICYEEGFADLDVSPLTAKFKEHGKNLDKEKLINLKLLKKENDKYYPTNALMIILGKFWHCTIKCARFKGNTMSVFTDKKEYGGDVFSILENTQSFVLNHINLKGEIKGLYRTDTYEIPVPAIREALINAIVHRDYVNQGRDIKVGIYDDIVNVVSPGGLPNTITIEDALNGRSEARNRVLANVFKELGLIEQWGTGLKRIINECKEHGLTLPIISEKNDFFDVEIFRSQPITTENNDVEEASGNDITKKSLKDTNQDNYPNDYERLRTIANDYERLKKEKKEILLYLLDNKKVSRKQAAEIIGLKNTATYEVLTEMVSDGLIEKQGQGRTTHYTLVVGDIR